MWWIHHDDCLMTGKRSEEGIPYHKEVIEWFENHCNEMGIDCDLR